MAERDQLARPLAAHDPGQLGDAEDVALGAAAIDDEAHRLGGHRDRRLGDRPARGDGLAETSTIRGRPVRSTWVRRRRSARGAGDRPSVGSIASRIAARGAATRRQSRSSHHSSTSAPAGSASSASGMTARASAIASADRTWLPCPPAPPDKPDRTRPRSSRTGRARRVALGDDPDERAPAGALRHRRRAGPRGRRGRTRRVGAMTGQPPERRTDEQLERHERRDGVARQPEEECPAGPVAAVVPGAGRPERERLPGLDGDPPQLDRADLLERRPDDVVRPDRDAARDDDRVEVPLDQAARRSGRGRPRTGPPRSRASSRLAAGRLDERDERRAVRVGDAGRAERAARRRGPRRRSRGCPTRGRRWTAQRARRRPRRPGRSPPASAGPGRARIASPRAGRCPARRIAAPGRTAAWTRHAGGQRPGRVAAARRRPGARRVGGRRQLDLDHGVGAAAGSARRSRSGSPCRGRPSVSGACPARTSPMTSRRTGAVVRGRRDVGGIGSRTRPSPSCPTAAGRSAHRRPRRGTRPSASTSNATSASVGPAIAASTAPAPPRRVGGDRSRPSTRHGLPAPRPGVQDRLAIERRVTMPVSRRRRRAPAGRRGALGAAGRAPPAGRRPVRPSAASRRRP